MPDAKPDGISDAEWAAIQAHRADTAPKRRATLRGTDKETGNEWEIELTADEAARLAGKAFGGLFSDDKPEKEEKEEKPTALKDYFGSRKPKAG